MILIVDDTPDVATLMVEIARDVGYYADFALDGPSAFYKIKRIHYSLVFIDIILPGTMNGNTLAECIKTLPAPHCGVPLVAMTGGSDTIINPELFSCSLKKPFLPRYIREVIEQYADPPIKDLHEDAGVADAKD